MSVTCDFDIRYCPHDNADAVIEVIRLPTKGIQRKQNPYFSDAYEPVLLKGTVAQVCQNALKHTI